MNDTYHAALTELRVAQQQFDQADPEYVDIAIMRLQAAELRLSAALRALKEEQRAG